MEHVDVLIVGAGLSGIGAADYIQTQCPWATYTVLEARAAIGGTWDLFRYPGVRSDSDMYTLGYAFRPWPGEKTIADGPSILQYVKDTAADAGIDRKIRFHHRVRSARWDSDAALWHVAAERADTGETVELTCGFFFGCTGYYRYDQGYLPDFEGLERFGGTVVHPQQWPEDLDYAGKRVVIIGSGATAVTLLPSMAATAAHVTMLQRSPSYIASMPAKSPIANGLRRILPPRFSGPMIRWALALMSVASYQLSQRRPALTKKVLRRGLEKDLPEGYDIDTHFTPRYDPWDQRMCLIPDGDLFRSISDGSASVVTDTIDTFTESGIRLDSGVELEADIVVTATGLELLFLGGIVLNVDGTEIDFAKHLVYKGMMLEDVPNLAIAVGYTNASWTLKVDLTCDYVCRVLNHMRDTGMQVCRPVNDDPSVGEAPLLGLTSGYVTRSSDLFPKAGSKFPWQMRMNYLADWRATKRRPVDDEGMTFGRAKQPVA